MLTDGRLTLALEGGCCRARVTARTGRSITAGVIHGRNWDRHLGRSSQTALANLRCCVSYHPVSKRSCLVISTLRLAVGSHGWCCCLTETNHHRNCDQKAATATHTSHSLSPSKCRLALETPCGPRCRRSMNP